MLLKKVCKRSFLILNSTKYERGTQNVKPERSTEEKEAGAKLGGEGESGQQEFVPSWWPVAFLRRGGLAHAGGDS